MKQYNSYKDSGVKWLGEIPSHWEAVPLKKCFSESETGLWGEEPLNDGYDSICIRVADFDYGKGIINNKKLTPRHYSFLPTKKKLQKGDLLLEKSGGGDIYPVGRVVRYNLEDLDATCSNFIQKLRTCSSVNSCYLFYLFFSMYSKKVNGLYFNQTTGIQNLKIKEFLSQIVFLPNFDEQKAIANYLDAVTSKIDEAIAQQQKMIDLLNERKQIIINNAVTKGLDPNVKMKPSGIDWIGDIPEHWNVRRGKYLFRIVNELSNTGDEELLTVSDKTGITPRSMKNVTMFMAESLVGYKKCKIGDICSNIMWMWHGAVGVTKYNGVISPSYGVYRQRSCYFVDEFLDKLLRLPQLVKLYTALSTGLTESRLRLYPNDFMNISFYVPPIYEQKAILSYLERYITPIDNAIQSATKQISLLQERKQIIINDVVTGKVKVV